MQSGNRNGKEEKNQIKDRESEEMWVKESKVNEEERI